MLNRPGCIGSMNYKQQKLQTEKENKLLVESSKTQNSFGSAAVLLLSYCIITEFPVLIGPTF